MSALSHILILVSYALVAAALAFGLPEAAPGIERATAFVGGGIVFVGGALLHEIYARRLDCDELAEDIHEVRFHQGDVVRNLEAVQDKVAALEASGALDGADILAEMRMLKALLANLAEKSVKRTATGRAKGAAPPAMLPKTLSAVEILGITRAALEENRVDLYLQPMVSLPQRKLRYFEAFSRIRSEEGGVIVPEQYIPIAEESGLVSTIDNMLLFHCVRLIRRRKHGPDVGFFCNISSHTLHDGEFFAQFIDFMEAHAELARSLIFEFSQADVMVMDGEADTNLERLAGLGFRFSMDQVASLDLDFADLRRRHFHFIKVDAQMLLSEYGKTKAAIDALDLAEAMRRSGVNLICEKVETERTVAELLDFNVDFSQGYLFGEPRLASQIAL